jgi:hypothetical protein
MAKTRFPIAGRRGRGLVWLVATLLALTLAGLGLEHGGGSSPTSLNGVLSAQANQAPNNAKPSKNGGGNVNPPGETDQGPGANPAADDDNGPDNDCDHPGDNGGTYPNCTKGGHQEPPPPPKCDKKHVEASESAGDDPNGEGTTKQEQKQEQKQDQQACKMSAHHKH